MPYFSGQGKVYIAPATAGVPGIFRYVGNCPTLSVALETQTLEHKESVSGQRLIDVEIITQKKATFTMVLEEFTAKNLALALYGADSTISGSTVVNEATPTGMVATDIYRTVYPKISSVVITDSAGTPATLTLGTHYTITSADHGIITIDNVASFTQPFLIDYAYAASGNVNMLTQGLAAKWVVFAGLNTADLDTANKPVRVELYRTRFNPITNLSLIGDELMSMELQGSVLYDATKAADAVLGQFGRILLIS